MDYYVVRIFHKGNIAPDIEICSESSTDIDTDVSLPHIEWILQSRQPSRYMITLELSPECVDEQQTSLNWNNAFLEGSLLKDDKVMRASYVRACGILLDLSNRLPAPGSFILHIFWNMTGIYAAENLGDLTPLLGAIKKLCAWHQGHVKAYNNAVFSERLTSIISFMDPFAEIHELGKDGWGCIKLSDGILWRGHLEMLSKDASLCTIHGFTLSRRKKISEPQITVCYKSEVEKEPSTSDDSFREDNWGYVWMDPGITVLSFIDITTVHLSYFSGKRFTLQYRMDERYQEDLEAVKHMCGITNSTPVGALLCCLDYAISPWQFDEVLEYSWENWHEAILKTPNDLKAPKYKFPHKVNMLNLLVRQSEEDRTATERSANVIQFTAHILHRAGELDFSLPYEMDEILSQKPSQATSKLDDDNDLMSVNLPELNPAGFFHKEENFNTCLIEAVKHWIDESNTHLLPMVKLQHLVDMTLTQLDAKQESILYDETNLSKTCESLVQHELPAAEALREWQLRALANRIKIAEQEVLQSKSDDMNPVDAMPVSGAAKSSIDMHMTSSDILKHFPSSGELMIIQLMRLRMPVSGRPQPSLSKLRSFKEALTISYHGITYNLDEHAAEKRDRMCRRLVERQVKYETSSIGSNEKVPSPATINIADSPSKRSLLSDYTLSAVSDQKRRQLKIVAEKLYQKRIRTRSIVLSNSSMVLRSTPKKCDDVAQYTDDAVLQSEPAVGKIDCDSAKILPEEQKRLRRRTYVKDNKKRLQDLVTRSLVDNGIVKGGKDFETCSKRLYNVSMAFLRDLKSSKDLDKIMRETVSNNVHSVISFRSK